MKPLYSSQFNYSDMVNFMFYATLISLLISILADDPIVKDDSLYLAPLFYYVLLCISINRYNFYEDKVEIVYPFRLTKRKREVFYSDISQIKYTNIGGRFTVPSIAFDYKGKPLKWINWSLDSFTHRRVEIRKDILVFLQNKDLPIIINSRFKEDFEILELTKANGSWMDYDVDGRVIKY